VKLRWLDSGFVALFIVLKIRWLDSGFVALFILVKIRWFVAWFVVVEKWLMCVACLHIVVVCI